MKNNPCLIESTNLSFAWGHAFCNLIEHGIDRFAPLIITVRDLNLDTPKEDLEIRKTLDHSLQEFGTNLSCETVAGTIFPQSLWNPDAERIQLYNRYFRIWPRVQKYRRNLKGVYFHRMIAFPSKEPINQLEHVISTFHRGNKRPTALQIGIFHPDTDHVHNRQHGFPCLQHIGLSYHTKSNGLSLTGYFGGQYIFERAYGNLLGLYRLGLFFAHEMELDLLHITNIASTAMRNPKISKTKLKPLTEIVRNRIYKQKTLLGVEK